MDDDDKSFGDELSDFFEDTYGLGIVAVAAVAITIPVAIIFGIMYLVDLFR